MKKNIYYICDMLLAIASVYIAAILKFEFIIPEIYTDMLIITTIFSCVFISVFSYLLGSYKTVFTYFGYPELIKQVYISFASAGALLIVKYLGLFNISGSVILISSMIFFALSVFIRALEKIRRWFLSKRAAQSGESKRVIIIGAGGAGAVVAKKLLDDNDGKYPVAFLDDSADKQGKIIANIKVFGKINKTVEIAKKLNANEIIIAIPSATKEETEKFCEEALKTGLPVSIFQNEIDVHNYQKGDKYDLKEVSIESLLFREPKDYLNKKSRLSLEDKVVLVTGGAGSIGFELCRQVLANGCKQLIICDINENGLYEVNEELKHKYLDRYVTIYASIRDEKRLNVIFKTYKPEIVFHAAAHKHVPMMEINPYEAVKNNIFGTLNLVRQTIKHKCKKFVMISTDKAVKPTNIMGASKRMCELIVKAHSNTGTEMVAVRFGNVLGSNGSVIPLFKRQIASGGPVTVTDERMTRYFMTIKEAVSLVLLAGANAKGGELFVLDMGQPVEIYKLAEKMIQLSGKTPGKDIEIKITGLRPGEKLYEELMLVAEHITKTENKKIFVLKDSGVDMDKLEENLDVLRALLVTQDDLIKLKEVLFDMVKSYEQI